MFLESDTTVAVLSGLPAATESGNPLTNDEIAQSRDIINMLTDGHSGYGNGNNYFEQAYSMGSKQSTNSLVTSLLAAGVGPNENVYAELGTTWQVASTNAAIGGPTACAHIVGKLLKYRRVRSNRSCSFRSRRAAPARSRPRRATLGVRHAPAQEPQALSGAVRGEWLQARLSSGLAQAFVSHCA